MSHSHGHACESESSHHDHDHDPPPEETNEVHSLHQYIQRDSVRTLNATDPEAGSRIIKPWSERWTTDPDLTSDADQQVIIVVPFGGQCKLKSILLRCPASSAAPKRFKVFINVNLDFDNCEDVKAVEVFDCVQYESAGDIIEYPVKQRLYNNVTSLTLFFTENWAPDEDEQTVIWYLGFRGEHRDLAEAPTAISYEAFANPKDHRVKGTEEMAGGLGL